MNSSIKNFGFINDTDDIIMLLFAVKEMSQKSSKAFSLPQLSP